MDRSRYALVITTCAFALSVLLAAPVQAQQQCTVPIAYWPMEGDGTEVINGFPGTQVGTADFGPGAVGQGLELDGIADGSPAGGPYLDVGMHPELTAFGGSELTIAAWVRRDPDGSAGGPGAGTDGAIVSARTQCDLGNYQFYGNLGTNLYLSVWGPAPAKPETAFNTFAQAPESTWAHVAVVYNGTTATFYVDGSVVHEAPAAGPAGAISTEVKNLQIGWDSCSSFWTGGIDELAIWNVALSEAEVVAVYDAGASGDPICTVDATVAEQIQALSDKVGSLASSGDLRVPWPLRNALWHAHDAVARGKDRLAKVHMRIFVALTKHWQRRGRVSSADAQDLIADATAIIDQL